MEPSLPKKGESKNDGETSRGNDQTIGPTDVMEIVVEEGPSFEIQEQTSSESIRDLNIPVEIRSFLDDRGYPIVNNTQNPCEVAFQKVPLRLRKKPRSEDYFDPMVISFGPYHHGKRELQEMNTVKDMAMLKFIKESGKPFQKFYRKVRDMNERTRACYVDCSEENYCDDMFALIMLRDGCFISYLMDKMVHNKLDDLLLLFVNHGNISGLDSAVRDMVLLENQIPLAVLELLMGLRYNNNKKLPKMIKQYSYWYLWGTFPKEVSKGEAPKDVPKGEALKDVPKGEAPKDVPKGEDEGTHVEKHLVECIQMELSKDVDRKKQRTHCFNFFPLNRFCLWNLFPKASKKEQNHVDDDHQEQNPADESPSYRSLSELQAKGIHFKPINFSPHSLKKGKSFSYNDVEFIPGFFYAQLKLPPLMLYHGTTILWNNLVAFEMCHPFEVNVVAISYINFLNALIASPDDVKELRSKRIILNDSGSDEEMFKFFKEIYTDSFQNRAVYRNVREKIEEHCRSKRRTWVAEIIYKYFRNPWSALGLFAAIAVVVLSFVQTYFTFYPVKDECMESICSYLKRQQIKND